MTSTAATIWKTLSSINVNDHIEKKQGFSYLSWAWAWGVLMEHYPESEFEFLKSTDSGSEAFASPDGTFEVRCRLSVVADGKIVEREMWLPVMDHKNNAIKNPNSRDVNDAKMRCLVKAMALFGLGHYIYAGEDLPDASKAAPKTDAAPKPEAAPQAPDAQRDHLLRDIHLAPDIDALKAAFAKAARYAKNRGETELLDAFTLAKDIRKGALGQ
jgi:hypothetical protein